MKPINYDKIAEAYDERYKRAYKPEGIASKLLNLAQEVEAERILEVACGTGHWLKILQANAQVYGLDSSFGMLQKAVERKGSFHLVHGDVSSPPFKSNSFDMICCINALHHFDNPFSFIKNTYDLLKPSGLLTVIGMNPHAKKDKWFIYDYFPGTYETDLKRYPSPEAIEDWMISADFKNIHHQVAERIIDHRRRNSVLPLSKDFTSQLTLLSNDEYRTGINRIESIIREAEVAGEALTFPVDVSLIMVSGMV